MHPWIRRFLAGFSLRINYRALVYIGICAVALIGALLGSLLSDGDVTYVLLFGAGFYVAGRVIAWARFRTWRY